MRGVIVKGIGGFYYVDTDQGRYECRARGKFRLQEKTPMVGDEVEIAPEKGKKKGYLQEILPRRNEMLRPPVANVDQFVLVLSASVPKADLLLADKLLIQAARAQVAPLVCLNKCDEADPEILRIVEEEYGALGCPFVQVSAKTGQGLKALSGRLAGKLSCFAGQSAVGKSSLLNALSPELELETGGLSRKTDRGRHTTRHAELMRLKNGYAMDTPGFSLLEVEGMEPDELCQYYPEMKGLEKECRFAHCLHGAEPDCAVKAALERSEIARGRYERYLVILEELKELKKKRYS